MLEAGTQQSCAPAREECNKYDLTTVPYFGLVNHNDWSKRFVISNSPTYLQNRGYQKYFGQVHIVSTGGDDDALREPQILTKYKKMS